MRHTCTHLLLISTLISLICFPGSDAFAQCDQEPVPTQLCTDASTFCGVDRCYTTQQHPGNGEPVQWCGPNTAVHNPSYFLCTATDTTIYIAIHINSCVGGGCGLQCALIDTCTGAIPPWELSNVVACDPGTAVGGTMVLDYNAAVPGHTYYLMIDGCAGQICEYEFTAATGVEQVNVINVDTLICSEKIEFDGMFYPPGQFEVLRENPEGCDTVILLNVEKRITIEFAPMIVCIPLSDSIYVEPGVLGSTGNVSYLWDDGSSESGRWIVNPSLLDTISLVVTDDNGCSASSTVALGDVLEARESAVAMFDATIYGRLVHFINTSSNATTFHWSFGDGTTDSTQNLWHVYDSAGTYLVQLVAMNMCSTDTIEQMIAVTTAGEPENDYCEEALDLGMLTSVTLGCPILADTIFTCVPGTMIDAHPDSLIQGCHNSSDRVVWYTFQTDADAAILNMSVSSDDISQPALHLFYSPAGSCETLVPVNMTKVLLPCVMGTDGNLEANGTGIEPNSTYYLALSAYGGDEGVFDLCLNVLEMSGAPCVTDADIEITSRSFGGPLEGPFLPGEEVGICMNVNNFQVSTGSQECQWFQGIVPVFGNGWDPASFDTTGQPLNATMNDQNLPAPGVENGSQWDWWTNVLYHQPNCYLNTGDLDSNGTLDLCHILYGPDCTGPGLEGGCCGPCWNSTGPNDPGAGSVMPPGWFASGVDGSCGGLSGWPAVDWGDGNTCNGATGPWQFCFSLKINGQLDTLQNAAVSLAFFMFADGETGSWTGGPSICANDMPVSVQLPVCLTPDEILPEAGFDATIASDTVVFVNTSQNAHTYQWDFGDGSSSVEENPVHIYEQSGTYMIRLVAFGNCSRDTIVQEISITTTSIENVEILSGMAVYPNPNNGTFQVQAEGFNKQCNVEVIDQLGIPVFADKLQPSTTGRYEIHIPGIPAGVYTVLLELDGRKRVARTLVF